MRSSSAAVIQTASHPPTTKRRCMQAPLSLGADDSTSSLSKADEKKKGKGSASADVVKQAHTFPDAIDISGIVASVEKNKERKERKEQRDHDLAMERLKLKNLRAQIDLQQGTRQQQTGVLTHFNSRLK